MIVMIGWIVSGAFVIRDSRRMAGPDGPRRIREMDAWQAGRLRAYQRRRPGRGLVVLGFVAAGAAVVWFLFGEWWDAVPGLVAAVVLVVAGREQRAAAPRVLELLDQLSLPEDLRETSRRRTRRVRQFGFAAVALFLSGSGVLLVGDWLDRGVVQAVGGGLAVLSLVALVAMAWAGAWVYGDEQVAA